MTTRPPTPPPAGPPSNRAPGSPVTPSAPPKPLAKTAPSLRRQAEEPKILAPVERAARNAKYALAAFTVLMVIGLVAWFARADQPWAFSSFVALLSAVLGAGATVLLWRRPTREHAIGGLAVIVLSLLRVGLPTNWTLSHVAVIAIIVFLAVPLVQAVIVLPRA